MPNRILRDGIISSPRVNALSTGAELFYRRLMSVVDDYGRFHASPATLRGACWPTCPDRVCEQDVSKWIAECSHSAIRVGPLINLYEVHGSKYLEIIDFRQQVRTKSKFPDPVSNLISDCQQNVGTSRSRSRISETEALAVPECATVNRFAAFLKPWPRVANPDHAARCWLSCVESSAEADAAFSARDRYLSSDEVKRGVVMDVAKWLMAQKSAEWMGKWPAAGSHGNHSTVDRVVARIEERILNGEKPL